MLRINGVKITNIGPIKYIELNFDGHFNIICGQNGVGKTTILDCLAQTFAAAHTSIKKTVNSEKGNWTVNLSHNNASNQHSFDTSLFHPSEMARGSNGLYHLANDIIVFRTHRDIPYKKLKGINPDSEKKDTTFGAETVFGSLPDDLKNWFVNRYLFAPQQNSLDDNQLKNFELAKHCFSILNPEIEFYKVIPNSFEILLNTTKGEIYLEYLSSGYKSCLAVLLGLIKEIELRYKNPSKYIKDFDGIVFIDELDLHLHPEWQAKIYKAIKEILPNAQIFTSTHSPHIIQVAKPDEIIALTLDEVKEIKLNQLINTEYGCQGWTVEEVLKDVMGMSETRTDTYLEAMSRFNQALENENFNEARQQFETIEKMLHPENSLRKILKIQLIGLKEND